MDKDAVRQPQTSASRTISVHLTPDEIWSLLMQYKDRDLATADKKLADAYKAAIGQDAGW